jgi:UDP-GlcNAc:polypeptide alpha-N-acetylglucosaminyltransferase
MIFFSLSFGFILLLFLLLLSPLSTTSASVHTSDLHSSVPRRLSGVNRKSNYFNSQKWEAYPRVMDQTFFMAIAAFRDVECFPMILDMMQKAANPRRIFMGVIEQNEHGDPTCIPDEYYKCESADFCPLDNIRRRITVSRNGRGPCFGRYVSMLMYRGENFYMMIDSHNQFLRNWDDKSIFQLHRARSPRPVVSHYPNGWDKNGYSYESQHNRIVMCNGHYMPMGYIRMDGRWMPRAIDPTPQPFSAGGYLFGDARLVHEVPFDPYLDWLFDGEEILYSARMFTHGFDIQTPGESVLFHDYNRKKAVRFWSVQNQVRDSKMGAEVIISQQRVQLMMQIPKLNTTKGELLVDPNIQTPRVKKEFEKFTIGKARTMTEYNWFAKIDDVQRKADGRLCDWLSHEVITKSGR